VTGVVAWLHPALGLVAVATAARAASVGRAARRGGPSAAAARAQHRWLGPATLGLMAFNWALGLGTVWLVRDDLEPLASRHAAVGAAIVALLVGSAITSRRIPTDPRARRVHPWLGATALVVAGVQVFLGLQLVRW
jgi:hypothetical protein